MGIDLGKMYAESRQRICALVSDEVGSVAVPATPLWDVHDLLAHVSGIVADVKAGNTEGIATDPWTAAQVERSRGRSIDEMVLEWTADAPLIEGFLSSPAGGSASRAVLDIHTHEADLLQALGRPVELPDEFLAWVGAELRADFAERVAAAQLPPADPPISDFELFRARLGRRTVAEVCAYPWPTDPAPYLDEFFIFGRAERSLGEQPVLT